MDYASYLRKDMWKLRRLRCDETIRAMELDEKILDWGMKSDLAGGPIIAMSSIAAAVLDRHKASLIDGLNEALQKPTRYDKKREGC